MSTQSAIHRELFEEVPHGLYNTVDGTLQTVETISQTKASGRNLQLRRNREPYQWIPLGD